MSELIPIARELSTESGPIDDVFLSPEGRLVIVETKLWKNPEKHRTVVAQVLDYAKNVSNWTYEQLDKAALSASRSSNTLEPASLDAIIEKHCETTGSSPALFQERVIENLASGRFLLLIVGDKISPNVALLGDAIHGAPGCEFQLGLVELCMYPLEEGKDWPLVITADVVGRTVERTRAVVSINYKQEKPSVTVEAKDDSDMRQQRTKTTLGDTFSYTSDSPDRSHPP